MYYCRINTADRSLKYWSIIHFVSISFIVDILYINCDTIHCGYSDYNDTIHWGWSSNILPYIEIFNI